MLRSDHSAFLSRLPVCPLQPGLLVAALLAAFAFGCTPKIGDSCTTSTNCSASGDRLCDITEPGGYCTIFNCEPGGCPDDSVCINFGTQLSPVNSCTPSQGNSPYQRSFCMAPCSNDGDCRGGYACTDLSGKPKADGSPSNYVGAVLADSSGNGHVCAAKTIGTPPDLQMENGVCNGDPDAGPPPADTGTGGAGGTSGAGDSGAPGAAGSNEAGTGG